MFNAWESLLLSQVDNGRPGPRSMAARPMKRASELSGLPSRRVRPSGLNSPKQAVESRADGVFVRPLDDWFHPTRTRLSVDCCDRVRTDLELVDLQLLERGLDCVPPVVPRLAPSIAHSDCVKRASIEQPAHSPNENAFTSLDS